MMAESEGGYLPNVLNSRMLLIPTSLLSRSGSDPRTIVKVITTPCCTALYGKKGSLLQLLNGRSSTRLWSDAFKPVQRGPNLSLFTASKQSNQGIHGKWPRMVAIPPVSSTKCLGLWCTSPTICRRLGTYLLRHLRTREIGNVPSHLRLHDRSQPNDAIRYSYSPSPSLSVYQTPMTSFASGAELELFLS